MCLIPSIEKDYQKKKRERDDIGKFPNLKQREIFKNFIEKTKKQHSKSTPIN